MISRVLNCILFLSIISLSKGVASDQEPYTSFYVPNKYVQENGFLKEHQNLMHPPQFAKIKEKLPRPEWDARPDVISSYWKAWEMGFSNIKAATPQNGFISPYIDPVFNGNIFMWDCSFMTMFGKYGAHAFHFQGTLDNFYCKQLPDGFICREIYGTSGKNCFEKYDPSSTGPNIMPWAEWEYYLNFNDRKRLEKVFPPLLAYYHWMNLNRTWQDGSYYLSGWGCGMDNQPRLRGNYHREFSHGHMSWIDANMQQILSGKILVSMARELGREADVKDIQKEVDFLSRFVNEKMWNSDKKCYADRFRDGSISGVQTIGAYWALLADVIPADRIKSFVSHLENPTKFKRPHRVPTLSADDPAYVKNGGGYWCGAVWAPTNYMVLRGLSRIGEDKIAFDIGLNHLNNVTQVFQETGTFFENYDPEITKGRCRPGMVGWTGLVPIAVLFEYVFGLRADVPHNTLIWDIRLTDSFGVKQYPFGKDGLLDLYCASRPNGLQKPEITVKSNRDFTLKVIWGGGSEEIAVKAETDE